MTETTKPAARKPRAQKPSEIHEEELAVEETQGDLLDGLPALKPAHDFRIADRTRFTKLRTAALRSNAFKGSGKGDLEYDLDNPEDVDRYEAFLDFVASIDEWAEAIAVDPDEYAEWSKGKTAGVFLALFAKYSRELGESNGS